MIDPSWLAKKLLYVGHWGSGNEGEHAYVTKIPPGNVPRGQGE